MSETEYIELLLIWKLTVRWIALIVGGVLIVVMVAVIAIPTLYRITATADAKAHYKRVVLDNQSYLVDSRANLAGARLKQQQLTVEARAGFVISRINHRQDVMEAFFGRCQDRISAGKLRFPVDKSCFNVLP